MTKLGKGVRSKGTLAYVKVSANILRLEKNKPCFQEWEPSLPGLAVCERNEREVREWMEVSIQNTRVLNSAFLV